MSFRIDESLGIHRQALELHLQRSEVLAANLANEDTPGYLARDLDFAAEMRRFESPLASLGSPSVELKYRVPNQPAQDGNTVELAVEQAEFSRNSMNFQTSLTFIGMKLRGLRQAIEGR